MAHRVGLPTALAPRRALHDRLRLFGCLHCYRVHRALGRTVIESWLRARDCPVDR
jgi:hypothetical protein